MNVPSAAMVTLPPAVVANVPGVAVRPAGRSLERMFVAEVTAGVAGVDVVPPVMTNCVLSTMLLPAAYESPVTFGAMARLYVAPTPVHPLASVTLTVIGKRPVWVGVPDKTPAEERERPVGRVPLLMEKVAGVCVPT